MTDIIIIGAGPAGMTAAIYARRAGQSVLVLEAMSYGNACLTSDIEECASVVEDKALTFRKGDVEDLRSKLRYLCDNPGEVEKLKGEAADYICERYNWDEVVRETIRVYKS